jgi:hypothetical protein
MAFLSGRAGAFGLVMALGNCLAAGSPEAPLDEYQVKAAFLYNFAKFVQWPTGTFQSPGDALAICILGEDPFGRSLADIVAGRTIEGRPLVVRHIASVKEGAACQILFVGSSENKRAAPPFADVKWPGVLTIGESNTPSADGAIINFRLDSGKVRFDINVEAAEREKLRISSRLLSLAHITETNRK